jgi:uncharacterized damage-inducible protein DinB
MTAQLLSSKEYFDRSTSLLEEADSSFRPTPEMMTAAQQVAHAAQTLDWFVDGATRPEGFDLDFAAHAAEIEKVTSLAAARAMLEAAFARAIALCRTEDLSRPLPPGPVMAGQPIGTIVWGMVEHTAHHRGALSVYSRLLGKTPPMPYGG